MVDSACMPIFGSDAKKYGNLFICASTQRNTGCLDESSKEECGDISNNHVKTSSFAERNVHEISTENEEGFHVPGDPDIDTWLRIEMTLAHMETIWIWNKNVRTSAGK